MNVGLLAAAWAFLPLLAIPAGLIVAVLLTTIGARREQGRIVWAFSLAMILDLPVRSLAITLERLAVSPTLWPVGV